MDRKVALQIRWEEDWRAMLPYTAENGFKYVSMAFGDGINFFENDWEDEIREMKEMLDSLGLVCIMTHAPYYNLLISVEILDEKMELALMRCMKATVMLGADLMAVHPRAWLRNELEDVGKSYFYNMQNLLPLVKEAERLGCRIGIENLPTYPNWAATFYSNFPEEHKRLIDDFNSPAVCGVWDFGHAHLATEDQAAAIAVLGSRIKGTHVHDNFRKVDDHLPPTEGEIDWKVMMQALKATGFDGYLTLEVHYYDWLKQGTEAIRDRVRHLYECVSKADEYLQV